MDEKKGGRGRGKKRERDSEEFSSFVFVVYLFVRYYVVCLDHFLSFMARDNIHVS